MQGDLITPPDAKKKPYINRPTKTIRGGNGTDDADNDCDEVNWDYSTQQYKAFNYCFVGQNNQLASKIGINN